MGFQIKIAHVTEVLFFLEHLFFFWNLVSLCIDGGKGLGFFKPNKFSLVGRV